MDLTKARLAWVELYAKTGDAGLVCRRCGISRPTLRKWWRRYQADGETGLVEHSRRPRRLAAQKVFADQEALILSLRRERRLGVKQLRNELIRQHDLTLSLDTIHRTLVRNGEQVLKRPRWRKGERRYSGPVPEDRVQMDVCKIRPGVYQYTAIDDCSRYKVLGVYSRATAANTLDFLERLIEEMPFPIQRIQTDRGREFFAEAVQQRLMDWAIKFRPIPPRSPHLNGKVERTQRADREEFWDTIIQRIRKSRPSYGSGSITGTGIGRTLLWVACRLSTASVTCSIQPLCAKPLRLATMPAESASGSPITGSILRLLN